MLKTASKKSILALILTSIGLFVVVNTTTFSHAFDPAFYTITMERSEPNRSIRKSAIMSRVSQEFPGQILSIVPHVEGGEDCHIVKHMGWDGEFRIIQVSCQSDADQT